MGCCGHLFFTMNLLRVGLLSLSLCVTRAWSQSPQEALSYVSGELVQPIVPVAHRAENDPCSSGQTYDAGLFTPFEDLNALSEAQFTTLKHPAFPQYGVRIKKTKFCDGTVECVACRAPWNLAIANIATVAHTRDISTSERAISSFTSSRAGATPTRMT